MTLSSEKIEGKKRIRFEINENREACGANAKEKPAFIDTTEVNPLIPKSIKGKKK